MALKESYEKERETTAKEVAKREEQLNERYAGLNERYTGTTTKLDMASRILKSLVRYAMDKGVNADLELKLAETAITALNSNDAPIDELDTISHNIDSKYIVYDTCVKAINAHKERKFVDTLAMFNKILSQGNEHLLKRACLACKFEVDLKDFYEYTLFLRACEKAYHLNVAKFLVSMGANIQSRARFETSALHVAAESGELPIVYYLIEELTVDKNSGDQLGTTALHIAAKAGNLPLMTYLIERNAKVDAVNSSGDTPLLKSCRWCSNKTLDTVKFLIANGANIKAITNVKETILHESCEGYSFECVKYLFDTYGLEKLGLQSVEATDVHGRTLLSGGCRWGLLETVIYLVEEKKANIHAVDNTGETIFFAACAGGTLPIVRYLIQKGVDKMKCDKIGMSPFHAACKEDQLDVVKNFVDTEHSSILGLDQSGMNALHCACSGAALDVVRYLIEKGVPLETPDAKNRTALYFAATWAIGGHDDTVKFLLEKGAKVTQAIVEDKQKMSPKIRALLGLKD